MADGDEGELAVGHGPGIDARPAGDLGADDAEEEWMSAPPVEEAMEEKVLRDDAVGDPEALAVESAGDRRGSVLGLDEASGSRRRRRASRSSVIPTRCSSTPQSNSWAIASRSESSAGERSEAWAEKGGIITSVG